MTKVVFEIDGMTCNHCRMNVEKALKAVAGVSSAEVNLAKKTALAAYDEGSCSIADMKAAIEKAGYEVVG
jgi:copper chaperone